ncbi:unnamed protein product [Didymodactylos carnosus]|uniref:Uncharacterized protein n=1 Tax=Didymodactylos carnosus TaxID=1234261 RepID=A0A8S2QSI3_9BILA|nr:unnamed protein product [Didymodactylos carnosus]CAF4123216.1 unnamed protein product [Didymodactylos carnosus]
MMAPRKRDYVFERKQLIKSVAPTATHPLGVQTIKPPDVGKQSLPTVSNGIDPLSVLLVANTNTVIDPLSEALAALTSKEKDKTTKLAAGVDDSFEPWSSKKASILTRYTTSEKISITTAIVLNDDDKEKMTITSQMATADRIKMRLEQLDEFEGGQETQSLTQQEYITRINDFNKEMIQSWKVDQRVKALKIVIQVTNCIL